MLAALALVLAAALPPPTPQASAREMIAMTCRPGDRACAADVRRELRDNARVDRITRAAAPRCARAPSPSECRMQAARDAAYRGR